MGAPGDRRRRATRHRTPARRAAHRVLPARGRLGVPVGVLRSRDGAHAAPLHAQGHQRRQHVGTRAGMGILGWTLTHLWSGEARFRDAAERAADWWLAHAPADRVAFWDFDDPKIPDTFR